MKKSIAILAFSFIFLMLATPTQATEIRIDETGSIKYFNDGVLGKTTVSQKGMQQTGPTSIQAQPAKTLNTGNGERLQLHPVGTGIETKISNQNTGRVRNQDDNNRLKLEMQAAPRMEKEDADTNREGYLNQVRQERQTRSEEMLQIRNNLQEKGPNLQLETRGVEARLKNGASFEIDPKTQEVVVTTPSGIEHTLEHLPDQAIERMKAAGVISTDNQLEDLELRPSGEGSQTVYRARVKDSKRFLGLFPLQRSKEVELDDTTGEISELKAEQTPLQKLLDTLSF